MEKIRVGKPVAKGGPLVKAIEPYGINFKVVLSNGYWIVAPKSELCPNS